ncbi:glycoside hydrolase [Gloeophyllum trabeum ATCC 11539]|uniref:Glycoside hydrolase n=1 Tax=Gloeophyllum trabeum (strain ATCC 11539 / FP-39264 / Madison 617) TaxID=670483 RepID=S7RSW4_GLOTA|nr:glycoside hydrolase [Gloeophyllum trabeum ATCC 11539]EPQ56174.1 glycoside hydrolase [Gloeophyllum trabeum ATCC 11539]
MQALAPLVALLLHFALFRLASAVGNVPPKLYGVNLEWLDMGGQSCSDCSTCIADEWSFAKAYPDTVDATFDKHWSTWFTEDHVQQLKADGINAVRIPLGYWIVEPLVNRSSEYYPRGGIKQLQRGLQQLQDAGMVAILDHHALPGVQTAGQQFTGHCTQDVEFYTPYNYHRALVWTAVMTALTHLDPAFNSVFAIEAVNEPIMNADQTPGYGQFQVNFVQTIRAVELILGIPVPGVSLDVSLGTSNTSAAFIQVATSTSLPSIFNQNVTAALLEAAPILLEMAAELAIPTILDFTSTQAPLFSSRTPLMTNFMDVNWQYNDPPNPAYAAIGPQGYDNHLYYNYGGVADPNPDAYMTSICNLQRVQNDAAVGDTPLWFGEWGLPTQFDATDEFLYMWADAQKMAYTKGAGWLFWNFHVEISELAGNLSRQWSYLDGVNYGFLTKDPAAYHNASVCDPYYYNTTSSS